MPTKGNSVSYIVGENNTNAQYYHKSINDILNYKSTRPALADSEVRMVSYIDSKPVVPYISLLPLQDFLKKEQELSRKGAMDKSTNVGDKNKSIEDNGQINWSKLLIEELNDMMKQKEDQLHKIKRERDLKEKQKNEIEQKINLQAKPGQNRKLIGNYKKFTSMNSLYGNANNATNSKSFKRESLIKSPDMTPGQDGISSLLTIGKRKLSKKTEKESSKQIPKIEDPFIDSETVNMAFFDINQLREENRDGEKEEMDDERQKKIEQMRKQEIIEFRKRGGFARVLHDLFYNPDVGALEFDSVYKLKQLCMQYYEKKGKLGKELVETLDVLLSDRPFTLRAKRKNFVIDDPNHPEGIKRKNFHYDIETMRINAEKDRIQMYKKVAQTCARTYYIICKRLSLLNLEEVEHAQYILDYMRNVIESGTLSLFLFI